mgnify:CR=1 FL=1|nr:MAG TPA: hypothetical protein [Caudoviricetes sp.]
MACARGSILRKDTVEAEAWRRPGLVALLKAASRRTGIRTGRTGAVGAELTGQSRMSATLCTVCYIDRMLYLRVSPSEPVWVTEDIPALFEVHSNTSWDIV